MSGIAAVKRRIRLSISGREFLEIQEQGMLAVGGRVAFSPWVYWEGLVVGVDDGVRTRDFRSHSPALYR